MNTKTKIRLDKLLGFLVAYPLNLLVRLVGKITRFDHSLKGEMKTIVVCKFKGMGSIIQATPLLQTLRANYPNAKIIFVSTIENQAILSQISVIDQSLIVDDKKLLPFISQTIGLVFKLIRIRADLYIDLEIYSNYSSIITTLSMARDRFGYYLRSYRYRMGMYTHMMYFNTKAPIAEAYLQFARLLGIENVTSSLYSIEQKTNPFNLGRYFVINPNASDLRFERRWPIQSFTSLIHRIREHYPEMKIVLIGSKNEAIDVKVISDVFIGDDLVIDLSGKTTLAELIELLRNAELVITNDTGPMHLASSLDTNVVALFGPCSPQQYGLGKNVRAIYKNAYCSPCVHEFTVPPCKGNNQCMQLITVDEVLAEILDSTTNAASKTIHYTDNSSAALGTVKR